MCIFNHNQLYLGIIWPQQMRDIEPVYLHFSDYFVPLSANLSQG